MKHLTEAESLAKYGTVSYTAWDEQSAQQDWLAKHPQATPQTTGAGATTKQPQTFEELLSAITAPPTGYDEAAKATEAKLPLIQQRYKTLLDEIEQSITAGETATKSAEESQLGEVRARAGAQGVYGSTTELAGEEVTRNKAAETIAAINASGATQKAKAIANQAVEEGEVTTELANLAIQKDAASREAYATALNFILNKQQVDIEAYKASKPAAGESGTDWLKYMASQYKVTAGQEDRANNAQIGLASIQTIRDIASNDPTSLTYARLGAIPSLLTANSRKLRTELSNVKDLLTRARTGAALNEQEQRFYNSFINNPTQAFLGYTEGTDAALNIMESIFNKAIEAGTNPYLEQLNQYVGGTFGIGPTNNDPLGIR